ncbi:MAG: hypothetical protein Q9212_004589, partial [Teloschistes hypoglaucus]
MVFNTISVGTVVTPTVIETYLSHYLNRKPLRQKPTAHISYHEGLQLIRRFLQNSAYHTVEEIQAFTSQWVPTPRWVKVEEVTIPQKAIDDAAEALITQLGHKGIDRIGGSKWWQWRRDGTTLKAEWIEMRADYEKRKHSKEHCKRIMLYVHGGAYFFGSVDEHRYQIQRHARKLGARVLARVLVILRDQGIPLPVGAILISPWVDLTHSFPSVAGDTSLDFIPPHGFFARPSAGWPPPNANDMEEIALHAVEKIVGEQMPRKSSQHERQVATDEATQGFSVDHAHAEDNVAYPAGSKGGGKRPGNTIPATGHDLSIMLDGNLVTIKDQIQMYATNQLISHPLVSPVLQPSLGGLPPLLVLTGGGEVLRDEQIYLAHKAANPAKYPPGEIYMNDHPEAESILSKWKPTDVQLQVWDDLCHVAPTLSFTRPAKFMYRSIAQFGAWALAKAQQTDIDIMDDDDVSVISSGSSTDSESSSDLPKPKQQASVAKNGVAQRQAVPTQKVGRAGDPLPPFKNHMIRQRVDRHGNIYPLGSPASLPALQLSPNDIGLIKPGPVRKWMAAKKGWDSKFAKEKRKVQRKRIDEMVKGYQGFGDDEVPPPSALAGRRGLGMEKEAKIKRSWGMSLWSVWGSSHDQKTIEREEKADKATDTTTAKPVKSPRISPRSLSQNPSSPTPRSHSRRRIVSYTGQSDPDHNVNENTPAANLLLLRRHEPPENLPPPPPPDTALTSPHSHIPSPSSHDAPISSPTTEPT